MGRKEALLAALIAWPVWAQEYTPALIPPQIIGSPQTMTALDGGDDSTRLVQLGFPFEYYGQTFTQAWVSTNGFVSFYGPANLCCNGHPIEQAQRNTIYGYWTDLISGGNPYYQTNESINLFGWYNTNEYGTNNKVTFEIGLFPDGKIQFNYGSLANTYHMITAGITGPTSADNVSLFHGQNVQFLQNQSGILSPLQPEPEPLPPPPAGVAPSPAPDPTQVETPEVVQEEQAADVVIEDAVVEDEVAVAVEEDAVSDDSPVAVADETQAEDANDAPLNPEELAALAASGAELTPEEVSAALEAVADEAQAAEDAKTGATQSQTDGPQNGPSVAEGRRDRNVDFFQREAIEDADTFSRETVLAISARDAAFVAQADAQYARQYGDPQTTEAQEGAYTISVAEGATFAPSPITGMVSDATSPSGQAQQMELLNMSGMQSEMASGAPTDIGDVNSGDSETMSQLAAIPAGYGTYTQARVPDAPFYQPKDIYRNRRIPDANMALYRMMQGQDARWQEMVEDQYE